MRKGGYKIVDFKGAELSSTVVVRPGIYSQIIDDYDKTILVSGVSLGGTLKDDSFASVSEVTGDSGDSVDLGVYGGLITVTEDDEVTFTLSSTPAELDDKIDDLDAKIGDLDDLETTDKDSVVGAINEVIESKTLTIGTGSNQFDLYKVGKIVVAKFSGGADFSAGDIEFGTITDSDFIPAAYFLFETIQQLNSNAPLRIQFGMNGNITGYNYGSAITGNANCISRTFIYLTN